MEAQTLPNLTWKLPCDQCAQDEAPRAQEPVLAFGFGRKFEERPLRTGGETLGRLGRGVFQAMGLAYAKALWWLRRGGEFKA